MSGAEAIMWAVERDPALRSDFCNLTVVERMPSEDRMRRTLERAVAAVPRLGQRVVGAPLKLAPPEFTDAPDLDLDAHLLRLTLDPPGDERALLDLCAARAELPLDRSRPLWEFVIVDGLTGGRAALFQKVHHAITDGVGALRLSLAFVDLTAEGSDHPPAPPRPADRHRSAPVDAAARGIDAVRHAIGGTARALTHPRDLPGRAGDAGRLVGSLQRQVLVTDRAHSDVLTGRSLHRRFETRRLSLPALRSAAQRLGGSVNDAYVTGLAGALGRYHLRNGSDVEALRLAMPVNMRAQGGRTTSNAFAPTRVLVPIRPADDPEALFRIVHDRLEIAKHETALAAAEGLAGVMSGLPTPVLVSLTRSQTRTIDFAASNLRGSPVPLYLAGERILANYPFGPRTGTPLNATVLSYCDDLDLGCNIDPAAVTDPDGFMADLDDSFADLLGSS
ncbi:MAG: wax ester/triacylglycerol synthase domain-containing protein [Actinomycetota bacterium]